MYKADIRCNVCRSLLGRRCPDGSVELREGGKLVAKIRWGAVGCIKCGIAEVQTVVPVVAAQEVAPDVWRVEGEIGKPS